jgi:SPP1 gp7 family putative phage head morphogenesis protein
MPEKDKNKLTDEQIEKIIVGIYNGLFTVEDLPKELYLSTANLLKEGIYEGYGGTLTDFVLDSPDYELLAELRENIYMFSAAKTFTQTLEMSDKLIGKDGYTKSFKDFKLEAGEIFETYDKNYLRTEYDTAIGQARAANKWQQVQSNKKDLPYLMYSAVMDSHTCEICSPLDKIVARVDDPFWDSNMPLNHFHCECVVISMDEDMASEQGVSGEDEIKEKSTFSQINKNPLFNMNPGKDKVIFQDTGRNKHPYFDVSKQYRELAKNNFNLEIPEKD